MTDPDSSLRVSIVDAQGRPVRAPGLAFWLARVAPRRARGEITVALVSDRRVRTLNSTYRRKDKTTDVLSFPSDLPGMLGDVVIARQLARKQARNRGHSFATELRILALHGLLHLMGYDHDTDRGRMRRFETRLRRKGNLKEGLIERTA